MHYMINDTLLNLTFLQKTQNINENGYKIINSCIENIDAWKYTLIYIMIAFGLTGNVCSFIILNRYPATTANFYLKALAVVDTLFLSSALFGHIFSLCLEDNTIVSEVMKISVKYILSDVTQFLSVWLIVVLACSRFLAVAKPFHVGHYFTCRKAWISTLT